MKVFDHVGIPTTDGHPNEIYVEETKVWITDPYAHPMKIEFMRFEPDSPVTGPVREMPHVAFLVDDLEEAIRGEKVLLGPFRSTVLRRLKLVFILKDGAVFEFLEDPTGAQ